LVLAQLKRYLAGEDMQVQSNGRRGEDG